MMGVEKEREAFEAWFESRYDAHFMQFALDLDLYADKHTQTCWEAWQAAKAQAVPDGFVLVPKEPNREFKDRLRSYLDNLWMGEWGCDWDGFICVNGIDPNEIWQFMIEAQEQAND